MSVTMSYLYSHGLSIPGFMLLALVYGIDGMRPSSIILFAIQGVLYAESAATVSTSGNLSVTFSYTASKATLSWTLPAVTSASRTKPLQSHAACAS